ncbi:hypothetical protein BGP_2811 [Beggiatoa sp. PS]|nr:hypothetical protein BGP_2811 [Beggiatoa sp. PS]
MPGFKNLAGFNIQKKFWIPSCSNFVHLELELSEKSENSFPTFLYKRIPYFEKFETGLGIFILTLKISGQFLRV